MRNIINMIIKIAIIWGAAWMFPEYVKITGYKDNGFGSGNAPDSVNRSDSDNDGSLDYWRHCQETGWESE